MGKLFSPVAAPQPETPQQRGHTTVPAAGPGGGISTRMVLLALARRYRMVLLVTAVVTAAAAFLVSRQRPVYRAAAVLQLTNAQRAFTGGLEALPSDPHWERSTNPILSQLQVLRSRSVVGAVVDREGLQLEPLTAGMPQEMLREVTVEPRTAIDTLRLSLTAEHVEARLESAVARARYGEPLQVAGVRFTLDEAPEVPAAMVAVMPRPLTIDRVLERLSTRPRPETNVIDVSYTSEEPRTAQRVVNAVAQSFQELSVARAQQQSTMRRVFLEQQLARSLLVQTQAQDALSAFRSREQVYSSSDKLAAQQAAIMALGTQIQDLSANRRMYESLLTRYQSAEGPSRRDALRALVAAPGLSASSEISQGYSSLISYETARDTMLAGRWGSSRNHPDVQRLAGMIEAAETQLIRAVRSHIEAIDAQIASLTGREDLTGSNLEAMPQTEAEEVRLDEAVVTTRRVADHLREELQKARIAEAVQEGGVEVIDLAALPYRPTNPWAALKLGLGMGLGLMLGTVAAVFLEHRNTIIRRRDELEAVVSSPTLGIIPSLAGLGQRQALRLFPRRSNGHGPDSGGDHYLVSLTSADSVGAEMYRRLRLSLLCAREAGMLKSLVVTSAVAGEGKSTTAANLAITFAERGTRVLLVDGDLRRACVHKIFGTGLSPGLAQVILKQARLEDAIRRTAVPGLDVLPAGMLPGSPERQNEINLKVLLGALTSRYDIVVLDAPPLLAAASAGALATLADGVLLVVRAGKAERETVEEALRQLDLMGALVIGTLLNDSNDESARYGRYYSAYTSDAAEG